MAIAAYRHDAERRRREVSSWFLALVGGNIHLSRCLGVLLHCPVRHGVLRLLPRQRLAYMAPARLSLTYRSGNLLRIVADGTERIKGLCGHALFSNLATGTVVSCPPRRGMISVAISP